MSDQVEQLTLEQREEYLRRKTSGGRNFGKGATFENRFAVLKLAQSLSIHLNTGEDYEFNAQCGGHFVDDLVVSKSAAAVECYQLKDAQSLAWGDGTQKTLLFDSYHEKKLMEKATMPFELSLVVSSDAVATKMRQTKPDLIANTTVLHFPAEDLFSLIENNHISAELQNIGKWRNAKADQLTGLARCILGRWSDADGQLKTSQLVVGAVKEFLRCAQSDQAAREQLRPAVKRILDAIPQFDYTIERGFFHYDCFNTSQTLNFDCFSKRFDHLQDLIEAQKPENFDDLEPMLMIACESESNA